MTTLYLIRHGETPWNADGRFQGQRDVPLNATGVAQAQETAAALAGVPFAAVYTSDLARAAQTAEAVATPHGLTPIADPRLRELHFGTWETHTLAEIAAFDPDRLAAWSAHPLHVRPPDGETLFEMQARVAALLADVAAAHPDATVAVVGHGGSVRAAVVTALGADLNVFRRLRLDNCSVSLLELTDGRCLLRSLNDICHLGPRRPHATWDEAGDQWRQTHRP
jgi:alpha-ribazole phosphatase